MAKASQQRASRQRRQDRFFEFQGHRWRIVYVDGYGLRHMQPDLDILLWRGDGVSTFVPPRQLWIDRRYRRETAFLIEVFKVGMLRKWTRKGDNDRYPPYRALREELKRKLCRTGPMPDFVVRTEWNAEHQLTVVHVRGDVVRKWFDPHFIFGGHDLVYPSYITAPRTVWLDVHQDPREVPYTLLHEAVERKLMARGWRYDPAHAMAIKAELARRAAEYLHAPDPEAYAPLRVVPIEQGEGACGPASAAMLLDYDGIRKEGGEPYAEADLIARCGCDPATGTDHGPLVEGLRSVVGGRVVHGQDATIVDLRRIVLEERRPVLVGWWVGPPRTPEEVRADSDLDEGHYAVVVHVSRTRVWLADPWIDDPASPSGGAPGLRKLPIREFLERWHDLDGTPSADDPGHHPVRGWYAYLRAP